MKTKVKQGDEKDNNEDEANDVEDESNYVEETKQDEQNLELEHNQVVGRKVSKKRTKPSYLICSPYVKKFVSTIKKFRRC